jgi:hypothetical protein
MSGIGRKIALFSVSVASAATLGARIPVSVVSLEGGRQPDQLSLGEIRQLVGVNSDVNVAPQSTVEGASV